jgi:hypothetical protein
MTKADHLADRVVFQLQLGQQELESVLERGREPDEFRKAILAALERINALVGAAREVIADRDEPWSHGP